MTQGEKPNGALRDTAPQLPSPPLEWAVNRSTTSVTAEISSRLDLIRQNLDQRPSEAVVARLEMLHLILALRETGALKEPVRQRRPRIFPQNR